MMEVWFVAALKRAMTIDDTEKNRERRDSVRRERPFQRGDLARVKGILESSSFISRLTTEHRQMRKCKANYIYIYISVAKQQLPAAN